MVLGARAGVKSAAIEQIHAAYSFGATRWQVIRMVILPSAMPEIFTAMRVGIGFGWTTLVAAEMVSGNYGLGYLIINSYVSMTYVTIIIAMVTLGVVGAITSAMVRWAGNRLMQWRVRELALGGQ